MNPTTWRILTDLATLLILVAVGGFLAWKSLHKSVEPAKLLFKWILSVVLIGGTILLGRHLPPFLWPPLVVPLAIVMSFMWAPGLASLLVSPLTNAIDGGDIPPDPQPFYSIAETKRRNGHPQEAIAAVREQLEKFPGDLRGTFLLASIQAEDLNDLPGAQLTLERWMEDPGATPSGKASALATLADWHLQFAQDPEAARLALERIVADMPGSPAAHQAAQRLAHLPTVEFLVAAHSRAPKDFQPGVKNIGLREAFTLPVDASQEPEALARACVEQLEKHPTDTATREKLAVLYAEHFHRLDLATDQLEQLIAFPNETPRHIVHWLNLLADLQIRVGKDLAAAQATLRRIIEGFPGSALAEPALGRLAALEGELRAGRQTPLKTLGHYEKNIGLKH
jgi:tetratricopeptide (TPR) repeat protein